MGMELCSIRAKSQRMDVCLASSHFRNGLALCDWIAVPQTIRYFSVVRTTPKTTYTCIDDQHIDDLLFFKALPTT